jgi:predicted dehydrogenase
MNVLIIGLGSIARKHIKALQYLKSTYKIYALRSNFNASIEEGVENIYDLDDSAIMFNFAIISNPTYLHFDYIEKLAHKGISLFIEKPAIHSLKNSIELVQLIENKKIITYVACNLRFNPCIKFLKNKLDTENLRFNEVNVYCGSYLPDWRPGKDFRVNYSSRSSMGGGVHLDLFHELDYTAWLFGLPRKSKSVWRNSSSLEIDAVDYANYVLEYDSFTANIILNYYRRKPKREIEIVLEEDTWTVDLIKNEIKNDEGEFLFKAIDFNMNDTYTLQLDYFMECLKNKQVPINSLKESLEILKICLSNEY